MIDNNINIENIISLSCNDGNILNNDTGVEKHVMKDENDNLDIYKIVLLSQEESNHCKYHQFFVYKGFTFSSEYLFSSALKSFSSFPLHLRNILLTLLAFAFFGL